jgi:hypothetical protein
MPKLQRRLTTLALSLVAGLLLLPATGQGATVFGSRMNHDPTPGTCKGEAPCTIVSFIHPSDPNGDPYSGGAPVSGVITKFRIRAFAQGEPGQVTFRVADINLPDPNNNASALATAAGTGPSVTIKPDEAALETPITEVGGRLPVKKGQHLAIDATKSISAIYNSNGSKFSYLFEPPLVEGEGARGSTEAVNELLVAATIEPDVDGDGFGDETQDQCPSQKTTQGQCDKTPPVVKGLKVNDGTISYKLSEASTVSFKLEKKVPGRRVGGKCVKQTAKNRSHKRCSRFRPIGASFKGGGKAGPNTVRLPNGKKLAAGTYRLTMTVTDVAGNKTTETTTFKVKKKKKRK